MRVLFICKGNVGRSQMAEAFFNRFSKHQGVSAGTHVSKKEGQSVHELVINCMAELGYDLSGQKRKQLTPEMVEEADKVVVITKKEDLPDYVKNYPNLVFWDVEDAVNTSYGFHCKIRDQIKT